MKLATRTFNRERGTGANQYYITSPFGWRTDPKTGKRKFHAGCDYGTHANKWAQYALEDGIVENVWTDSAGAKCVRIRYDRLGYRCTYAHLDRVSVYIGQTVTHDTIIGYTGMTGYATGIHLHLGVQNIGSTVWINPESIDYTEPSSEPEPSTPTPTPTPVTHWKGVVKKGSILYDINGERYPNGAAADRVVTVTGELGDRWEVWGETFSPHTVYVNKSDVTKYNVYPYNAVVKKGSPLYNIYGKKYPNNASADRPVQVRGFVNGRYQVFGSTFNPNVVYVDKSAFK